jgi:Uma2 family endonuclease
MMRSGAITREEAAMASAGSIPRFTPEQYLALERKADFKSEYFDGFLIAMAGASREHNLIAGNLHGEIRSQFKGRSCEVYIGDMRVRAGSKGPYTYPDVVAVCGGARFLDDLLDTLLNPTLIVEVLSATTERHDRGDKFTSYRKIPSLREYVLVAQDKVQVERYTRQGEEWVLTVFDSLDQTLRLTSIECEIPLREIYAKVDLPAKAADDA